MNGTLFRLALILGTTLVAITGCTNSESGPHELSADRAESVISRLTGLRSEEFFDGRVIQFPGLQDSATLASFKVKSRLLESVTTHLSLEESQQVGKHWQWQIDKSTQERFQLKAQWWNPPREKTQIYTDGGDNTLLFDPESKTAYLQKFPMQVG